ncbi:hypothetical protein NHX12_014980 [Muraenolepis orangiensis]|uniref:Uncharacterized protein n=1 Tax=Muraenolepis orangiensis TaxID=630683 RepID=A0A9Q0I440_9TELE|nr:hypothetical protein NHX12_014980 [Muraenolepis orangiensis]
MKRTILGSDEVAWSLLVLLPRVRVLGIRDLLSISPSSSLCLCRWLLAASQEVLLRDNLLSAFPGPEEVLGVSEPDNEPAEGEGFQTFKGLDDGQWGEGDSTPSEVGPAESEELEDSIAWFWTPWKDTQV